MTCRGPEFLCRHKDLQPLHLASDDVDYWAPDLIYASQASESLRELGLDIATPRPHPRARRGDFRNRGHPE